MYGQLPSYVKANATTYDIMVMDTMLSWEKQEHDKASGVNPAPELSQADLQAMLDNVRKQ
jgi:hypothetical protein